MKLVERAGTWQVHFQDTAGNRQRTSTKIKVNPALPDKGKGLATLAALDIMRADLSAEVPAEARAAAGKVRTLAYALRHTMDTHWEKKRSAETLRYRVEGIIRDRGYWRLSEITYTMLEDYGRELEARGDKPATRNRKMSVIHTAMTRAHWRGEITSMPKFPRWTEDNLKERYLTLAEEQTLAVSMERHYRLTEEQGQYLRHLTPFLLDTGLRAGEVSLLTRDRDLGDRIWLPHGTTKSGKGRTVPLTARAREALTAMLATRYHRELLELRLRDKAKPSQHLGKAFHNAVVRAGIPDVTLHTLRHTCASRLVQAGVSLYAVKEWLGHSSITVTERYAHLAPKTLDAARDALEAIHFPPAESPPQHTTGTELNP
jgi:integrase